MPVECWLCTYATDPLACQVTMLVNDNIHSMSPDVIAIQCSLCIEQELKRKGFESCNKESFSSKAVHFHITNHMLHANVVMSNVLRQLMNVNGVLYKQIMATADPGSGADGTIDSRQIRDYLAVTSQITAVYKTGEANKLLFAQGPNQSHK